MKPHNEANGHILMDRILPKSENFVETMNGLVTLANEKGILPLNGEHLVVEENTDLESKEYVKGVEMMDVAVLKEKGISPSNGKIQIFDETCKDLRSEKDAENVEKVNVRVLSENENSSSIGKQQHVVDETCTHLRGEKDTENIEKMDVPVLKETNNNIPTIILEDVCVEESACIRKSETVAKATQHNIILSQRPEATNADSGLQNTEEKNEDAGDSDVDQSPDNEDQLYQSCDEVDGQLFLSPIVAEKKVTEVSPDGRIDPDGHIRRVSVSQLGRTPDTQIDASDNVRHDDSIGERQSLKVETEKRTEATLKINGNVDFCKIETARYKFTNSLLEDEGDVQKSKGKKKVIKQHYIKEMIKDQVSGETLLKPLDELLEVNTFKLTDKSQKYVLKTFREIKLKQENDHLQLKLDIKVRRWLKDENKVQDADSSDDNDDDEWAKVLEIDISLVLVPVEEAQEDMSSGPWAAVKQRFKRQHHHRLGQDLTVRSRKEDVTKEKTLPRGNLNVYEVDPAYEARIKICDGSQRYIRCTSDGMLTSDNHRQSSDMVTFTLEPFKARDLGPNTVSMYAFCCRICCERDGGSWYMLYDHDDAGHDLKYDHDEDYDLHCQLHMKDDISSDNIDSRCFIKRQKGNNILLQSAVERDRFVHSDGKDGTFTMKEIDTAILEKLMNQDPSALKYFDGCWFDPWRQKHKDHSFLSLFSCGLYRSKRRSHGHYSSRTSHRFLSALGRHDW